MKVLFETKKRRQIEFISYNDLLPPASCLTFGLCGLSGNKSAQNFSVAITAFNVVTGNCGKNKDKTTTCQS